MPRNAFLRAGARVLLSSIILTLLFAIGVGSGLWLHPKMYSVVTDDDHHDDHEEEHSDEMHDDHEEEDHVALTEQAFENLNQRLGVPIKSDFWKSTLVPGKVVEIPGRSDLAVSAPVAGVIESVEVVPGQNLPRKTALFTLRLTDEALLAAQAKYLELLTKQEVAKDEIARLTPLIGSGSVSGATKRGLEYEVRQLAAQQKTVLQELRGRGLPAEQIQQLQTERTLASTLFVFAPKFVSTSAAEDDASLNDDSLGFSIEDVLIHPGKSIERGESLCTVAYHRKLYIEGTAFETDLPTLQQIALQGWAITTEAISEHSGSTPMQLKLLRVDNHIDEATQTVRFFIELPNEVMQTLTEGSRQFEQWRFRPGQRLHLRLPVERWENQITLPVDAVVIDGPNAFVFVEHHHEEVEEETAEESTDEHALAASEADHDDHDHDHDVFMELEPVSVRLLHRDDKTVVIADDGQLHDDDQVAMNNAYKLYLAMKMQAGGGGGHHHHHDH